MEVLKISKDFKVLSPVVERYTIVVSVPMSLKLITIKGQNIYEVEEAFAKKRERTDDKRRKIEFDRVRALLKYASTFSAQLEEIYNSHKKLVITLSFDSLESLNQFSNTMSSEVNNATMK